MEADNVVEDWMRFESKPDEYHALVIRCGDGAHGNSRRVGAIDDGVSAIANRYGIPHDEIIYDVISGPGKGGHVMGMEDTIWTTDKWWGRLFRLTQRAWCFLRGKDYENLFEDRSQIQRDIQKYLKLHGQQLLIISNHWACGREGCQGHDPIVLLTHLLRGMKLLQKWFPDLLVGGMFIRPDDTGRQRTTETFITTQEIERRVAELAEKKRDMRARLSA